MAKDQLAAGVTNHQSPPLGWVTAACQFAEEGVRANGDHGLRQAIQPLRFNFGGRATMFVDVRPFSRKNAITLQTI